MSEHLSNAELRELKARAQRLEPAVRLGREGASAAFYAALEEALTREQLVKVKFADFKEEKKTLAPEIAEHTGSRLVMRVGNVAVYYRPKPAEESEGIDETE
jgi:RNA-binding protein